MRHPYPECSGCVATPFCKKYNGQIPVTPETSDWCRAKFRLDKAIELSRIPEEYKYANVFNYKVDSENQAVYERFKPKLKNIVEEVENGTNFLLFGGDTGVGKTYLAVTILNQYIYKSCLTDRFDFETPLALFVSHPDLMDALRYRRDSEETETLMEAIYETPLLLLDDIGAGTFSDFVREQTLLIINYRVNARKSIIATTNYDLNTLKRSDALGSRSVSRLLTRCVGAEMSGRDRRYQK